MLNGMAGVLYFAVFKNNKMNWRIVVGIIFLVAGMVILYSLIEANAKQQLSSNPIYAQIGCGVWMAVGIFLILQGVKGKGTGNPV
jgi:ascorbate-specific PTS system EIIC-type component UlaA